MSPTIPLNRNFLSIFTKDSSCKKITWQRLAAIVCALSAAVTSLSAHAQSCVTGTWQSPPNSLWDIPQQSFPVQAESARFQIRWPADKPTLLTPDQAKAALALMENFLNWFTGPSVKWPQPFCDTAVKYKIQIFTNEDYGLTGGGRGDRSPAMWVAPGDLIAAGLGQVTGIVHELTHSMQFHSKGMRDTPFGGWLWESHAEFMAHQYPGNTDKIGCSSAQAWMPHLYYGNTRTRIRYCNWQFWDHLKNKYGFSVVNNIFINSADKEGQDPFTILMQNQGWSPAQLGDEFGQFAMKNVNWDYVDAQDNFDRGAAYRSAYGPVSDLDTTPNYDLSKRLRLARLEAIDVAKRRFVVSKYFAPQRYGYNHVKLIPDAGATKITVNFRGVVQNSIATGAEVGRGAYEPGAAPDWTQLRMPQNPASNWRWGVVAIDKYGKARYSDKMQSGIKGNMDFALQAGDQGVYLVVAATPDQHHSIFWDQKYHTLYRYAYKVQLAGAMPDGYQPGYQANLANQYPAQYRNGARHPNGGGWVARGATVHPTAYVGPNAAVLGGKVLGSARIEDYAVVWNGTVKGNAIVGGLTQLDYDITIADNASVRSVMAGWRSFNDGSVFNGNTILFGDLETYQDTTPVSKGVFSGLLDTELARKTEYGANRTKQPVEVTAPVPLNWPNDEPSASLTAPANNSTFMQGATISFSANANDTDGTVARVDLFDNGNFIGAESTAPFAWTFNRASVGNHVFTVKAFDNEGASSTSTGINVIITAPPAPPAPPPRFPPSNAIKCASQHGICALPAGKTATVWYGFGLFFKVKTGMSGNVTCDNATFGDPLKFFPKSCYYLQN